MVVSEGFPAARFRSCLPRRQLNASSAAARFCSLPCGSTQAAGLAGQSDLRPPSQRGLVHMGRGLPLTERALWSDVEESGAP